jgi:hypothetical protein
VGLLLGLSLFTYGLGGLVYWLVKRKHWTCPNCGLGWEHSRKALPPAPDPRPGSPALGPKEVEALPGSGIGRRVVGVAAILLALVLIVTGIAEAELAAIGIGSIIAGGGMLNFWWGHNALQERRRALMTGLQRQILLLATEKGGTLTVTEVAASLNLSLPAAEKLLISMDDGFRVRSEVTDRGIVVYEFPEVQHRKLLDSGSSD